MSRAEFVARSAIVAGLTVMAPGCGGGGGGGGDEQVLSSAETRTTQVDPRAAEACKGTQYPGTVVGAYATTAGTLRTWRPRNPEDRSPIPEPQFLTGRPADEEIFVCYVDGTFAPPHPPTPDGDTGQTFDRAIVMLDAGGAEATLVISSARALPVVSPDADS